MCCNNTWKCHNKTTTDWLTKCLFVWKHLCSYLCVIATGFGFMWPNNNVRKSDRLQIKFKYEFQIKITISFCIDMWCWGVCMDDKNSFQTIFSMSMPMSMPMPMKNFMHKHSYLNVSFSFYFCSVLFFKDVN